jgi:hypothetical protein
MMAGAARPHSGRPALTPPPTARAAACCPQEKSAKRAAAKEPAPLTDVQRMWRQMAEQEQQPAQLQQEVAAAPRPAAPQRTQVITSTPLVTVTWKIRLTSLGVIPMPWMEQQQS